MCQATILSFGLQHFQRGLKYIIKKHHIFEHLNLDKKSFSLEINPKPSGLFSLSASYMQDLKELKTRTALLSASRLRYVTRGYVRGGGDRKSKEIFILSICPASHPSFALAFNGHKRRFPERFRLKPSGFE